MDRKVISSDQAPAALGPYSQGVSCGGLLFCAGQIPLDPSTGRLVKGDTRQQAMRVIENLRAILEAGGSRLSQVLRLDVYLTDLSVFPEVNEYLSRVFPEAPPARVTVEVSALPLGAQIEMAAIAAISKRKD